MTTNEEKEKSVNEIAPLGKALLATSQRRRFAVVAAVAGALVVPSLALAGGSLVGTYSAKIVNPPDLRGTWTLSLTKGGAYTVALDRHMLTRGRYSTAGSKVTFGHETGDGACSKSGTYTWRKSGKTLRFKRVSDSPACDGRMGVLAHAFTRKG